MTSVSLFDTLAHADESTRLAQGGSSFGALSPAATAADLLETANRAMSTIVRSGYAVEPQGFYVEAMRLLQLRLRAIRFLEAGEK